MPFLKPAPNSPALPTVPAAWKAGARPGPIQQRPLSGTSAAVGRPSTAASSFIRKTGSDTNGGSSASVTPDKQGTDGVTNGTTLFTSATGTFAAGDVNKLIMIGTKARYRIVAVAGATSITLSGSPSAGSGLTYKVGGAVATIGALLTIANSPAGTILAGDTIWIGAGTYREAITVGPDPLTFPITIEGDVTGANTGDPGMVLWTAYTTDDKTAPGVTTCSLVAKQNYTFRNIMFVSGTTAAINANTSSRNLKIQNCGFLGNSTNTFLLGLAAAYGQQTNNEVSNCYFAGGQIAIQNTLVTGAGGDYNAGIKISNCMFVGQTVRSVYVLNNGVLAGKGGGVICQNSSFYGTASGFQTSTSISLSIPSQVTGCLFFGVSGFAIIANNAGQIVENWNWFATATRNVVPLGPNSIASVQAPLFHFGQESLWGAMPRAFGEPMVASPFLGVGDSSDLGADLLYRPRPSGQYSASAVGSAVGALGRGNTAVTDPTPIGTSTTPFTITGPGFEDFWVPVPAAAVTVSCSVRFTGVPPILQLLANPTIGVNGQQVPEITGVPNVVHTVTLLPFTPTAAGNMVVIRVWNIDPSGSSVIEVDDFTVSG